MASLQKIIKVTKAQYQTLSSGGTVGSYTGLDPNYIYLVEDDGGDFHPVIDIDGGLTASIRAQVQESPNALLRLGEYLYVPNYQSNDSDFGIPTYYSCFAVDEKIAKWLEIDWNMLTTQGSSRSIPSSDDIKNGAFNIIAGGSTASSFTANQSTTENLTIAGSGGTTVTAGISQLTISSPAVNNGTLTIQKNGASVAIFTANQSGNSTANITVPTTLDDISDGSTRKLANYLPLSGGTLTGDLTLYTESGDSPRFTFQRGILTDSYNDWSLYDSGGYLYVQQRGGGSSVWETRATFTQNGVSFAGEISEGGTALSSKYLGKTAKAADADKLDGQDSAYYLNYNNITNPPTLGTAAPKNYTTSVTQNSADLVTSGAVWSAIDNLPEPMVFKGTLGTGGTITSLPAASTSNNGFTYKVITAGTYQSIACKVGDVVVSNGSAWTLIPAGDTDSDTWRGIKVNGTELLGSAISTGAVNFKNGSNVTISGSGSDITISASQPTVNNGTLTIQGNGTSATTFTANQSGNSTLNIKGSGGTTVTRSAANEITISTGSIPTVNNATLTIQKNGTTVNTFTANASSNVTANITVPTKTSEITNDSGFLTDSANIKESKIVQDTYNTAGSVNEYDRLLVPANSADRLAFIAANTITIQYSTDGGTTWNDYGASDTLKRQVFAMLGGTGLYVGSNTNSLSPAISTANMGNYLTRVIITYPTDKYCQLNKFYCNKGGPHNAKVMLEVTTWGDKTTWSTWRDWTEIRGWTGPNMMTLPTRSAFGDNNVNHIYSIRLTFGYNSIGSETTQPAQIGDFRFFGITAWAGLAQRDTPYYWDSDANVIPSLGNKKQDLGVNSNQWKNIYGETLYENGTSLANKYLGKTAKADNADKLDGNDSTYYAAASSLNNYVPKSLTTTKGDIIYASAANTPARLGIGVTGQVLTTSSSGVPAWANIAPMTSVTWSQLKAIRDTGNLIPGMQYRITDYQCTTTKTRTASASHQFDIIVVADSESKLNENARACLHSGDTYFSNSDLNAWRLKYCFDNDTARFDWADSTNGKGVIYEMEDEFGNKCPYDFKNMQFTDANGRFTTSYTFNYIENSTYKDASLTESGHCYGNVIDEHVLTTGIYTLGYNVFYSGGTTTYWNNNHLKKGCYNNLLRQSCAQNDFDYGVHDITIGDGGMYNKFGVGSRNISLGSYSYGNTFAYSCYAITIGMSSSGNTFGPYCHDITFGDGLGSSTFNACSNIVGGRYMYYINIGQNCSYIKFGGASSTTDFHQNITIEPNCSYLYIAQSNLSYYIYNVHLHMGVKGPSSSNRRTITVPTDSNGSSYEKEFVMNNSTKIVLS